MLEFVRRIFSASETTRPYPVRYPRAGAPVRRLYTGRQFHPGGGRRGAWMWQNVNSPRRRTEHYGFREVFQTAAARAYLHAWTLHSRSMAVGWEGPKFVISFTSRWTGPSVAHA